MGRFGVYSWGLVARCAADSDSSTASPRIGASFPASPELASEKSRTGLEGACAFEASYQDPGQALATDCTLLGTLHTSLATCMPVCSN